MEKSIEERITEELNKLDFNNIVAEVQNGDYFKKVAICGNFWKIWWWYGRGKHKNMRYGYAVRYEFLDSAISREYAVFEAYISSMELRIPPSGKAEPRKIDMEIDGMQYRKWMKEIPAIN